MKAILLVRLLRFTFPIVIIGALFKLMHWPYSQEIMTVGLGLILILYPIRFYLKPRKRVIDYVKLLLLITYPINAYLRIFHLPSHMALALISFCAFVLWILLELYDKYTSHVEVTTFKVFPFPVISVITLFLIMCVFYQLTNNPYATPILIIGFIFLTLYFLIDSINNEP